MASRCIFVYLTVWFIIVCRIAHCTSLHIRMTGRREAKCASPSRLHWTHQLFFFFCLLNWCLGKLSNAMNTFFYVQLTCQRCKLYHWDNAKRAQNALQRWLHGDMEAASAASTHSLRYSLRLISKCATTLVTVILTIRTNAKPEMIIDDDERCVSDK